MQSVWNIHPVHVRDLDTNVWYNLQDLLFLISCWLCLNPWILLGCRCIISLTSYNALSHSKFHQWTDKMFLVSNAVLKLHGFYMAYKMCFTIFFLYYLGIPLSYMTRNQSKCQVHTSLKRQSLPQCLQTSIHFFKILYNILHILFVVVQDIYLSP